MVTCDETGVKRTVQASWSCISSSACGLQERARLRLCQAITTFIQRFLRRNVGICHFRDFKVYEDLNRAIVAYELRAILGFPSAGYLLQKERENYRHLCSRLVVS